ncbi:MAG: DinB family protein [Chloroflexota bacterium]
MTTLDDKDSKRQIAFLRRLAAAKERLAESIKGLDEFTLCNQPVLGDWTTKDILGHIVSWNEEFRANIEMILQGKHPGYDHAINGKDNFSAWNQQWILQKRSYPLDRILAEVERDYQEAVELIKSLKTGNYRKRGVTPWKEAAETRPTELGKEDTDTVETLVTYHWRHMNQHIGEIEAWRKRT